MKKEIVRYHCKDGWIDTPNLGNCDLVLAFVHDKFLDEIDTHAICKAAYPNAEIMLIGSGGQTIDHNLYDDEMCIIAIQWQNVRNKGYAIDCDSFDKSFSSGAKIAEHLNEDDLKHILVFADAQHVNGEQMIAGIYSILPESVSVSGGFASDNAAFKRGLNGLRHC